MKAKILDITLGVVKILGICAALAATIAFVHFVLWMGYYSGMPM